jgi:hypothetical protein
MRKSIITFLIFIFCFSFTAKAQEQNEVLPPVFDYQNNKEYQALASDFREYTICGAIHDSLLLLVSANYGVGSNLGYPPEFLNKLKDLMGNIISQRNVFDEKTKLVIKKLMIDFKFPQQGLMSQAQKNRFDSQSSVGMGMAQGKENPQMSANLVKGLLVKSQSCREYVSTVDYSNIE